MAATPLLGSVVGAAPLIGGTAALATRFIAPLVPGYLMGSGETYEEAKKLKANEKDAQGWAVAGGVGISLLEKIGAAHALKNVMKQAGDDFVIGALGNHVGKETVKQARKQADEIIKDPSLFVKRNLGLEVLRTGIKSGAVEAGTEGAQEAIQIGAAGVAADKGINPYTDAEYTNRIIDAAALGFVGGKTVGTGAGVVSNLQHKDVINRTEQRLKEVDELEKATKDMSDDQIRTYIASKRTEYKPSYLSNVFATALSPLVPLANKNQEGYAIYNALSNYYDNVSASVGKYAKPLDEALQNIRRTVKAPLIQGSLNPKKNKELYNLLQYGTASKDPSVQKAATIIRNQILGTSVAPEIRITKDDVRNGLLENQQELEPVTRARTEKRLDNKKIEEWNTKWNRLRNIYQGTLNAVAKTNVSKEAIQQEQEKVVNKSVNNIKQAVNGKMEESVKENGLSKKHEDLFNELFGEK